MNASQNLKDNIKILCIQWLANDNIHNKQWYLEEILKEIIPGDINKYRYKFGFDWDNRVAP